MLFLGLGLSGQLAAQQPEQQPAQQPAQQQPKAKAAEAAASKSAQTPTRLAKVLVDGLQPRCFASERSVRYEDRLAEGSTVEVVGESGDFFEVRLPLGVVGYVSKRFATGPDAGLIKTTRPRVAFRYRPTPKGRAEAPVQTMPEASELKFLADAKDWWKVRYASNSVYLAKTEVQVFESAQDTLTKAYADFGRRQEKEWQDAAAGFAATQAAAALRVKQEKALASLGQRFQEELRRPVVEQDVAPIAKEIGELLAAVAEDDEQLRAPLQKLQAAVTTQESLIEAKRVLTQAQPLPAAETKVKPKPVPADPMERFGGIGWLSVDEGRIGIGRFRLMKGRRVICYINCKNLRYDLALFEGVEVGVVGEKLLDAAVPYIEVREIEVLGHAR